MADAEEEYFSYFPDDFKDYMLKELKWLRSKYFRGGVFWSREDDEPQRPSTLPDGDISNLNKIIRDLICITTGNWAYVPILVQFWAPITTKEGRSFLTTRNQPFSLASFVFDRPGIEGLCGYRMICMDSKFDIDLDGGKTCEQHLPARVFKHQFPESTPNVEFYSITEYPQRDNALSCGVQESLAFPVFESSTRSCVGVIEVVSPEGSLGFLICNSYFQYGIDKGFEEFDLICSFAFPHKDAELDDNKNEAHKVAFDEIKYVLKRVCDVYDVPFAQAWVPCKMGWPCRVLVNGGILHASCYYEKHHYGEDEDDYGKDVHAFRHISSLFHLKNGMGVVGKAHSSYNMVFCRDVTQLSLTEYPLAHYARKARLNSCFAICLESNYTGNDVYVLEFFMPMRNNASENRTSLRKILETMRTKFHCLRLASRELLENLRIEEISIQNDEKLDPVQIPQATISLPQLELSQSEVEVMQVDSSDQQLVNEKRPAKEQVYRTHSNTTSSYGDALPYGLKSYIKFIKDVDADGNCGFRAIAGLMGFTEAKWGQVRRDLLQELQTHKDHYTKLYGLYGKIEELTRILSYFEPNPGHHHWLTMPEMGHLIASCYNVVVMLPDHPVPPIADNWCNFRYPCAAEWGTAYGRRIEHFKKVVDSSVATRETFD